MRGAAVLLDFPLPLAMYKKLLGQVATLRELAEFDPTLGRSLQALLDYAGCRPPPPLLRRRPHPRAARCRTPSAVCFRGPHSTLCLAPAWNHLGARPLCACASGPPFHRANYNSTKSRMRTQVQWPLIRCEVTVAGLGERGAGAVAGAAL